MELNMTLDENGRNNSNDNECRNSTELLSNATWLTMMDTTSNDVITQQDEPDDNPEWTETDWEGPSPKETTATVVVILGKSTNQYGDSDWRSQRLENMFGLFSGLTRKKESSATPKNTSSVPVEEIIFATGLNSGTTSTPTPMRSGDKNDIAEQKLAEQPLKTTQKHEKVNKTKKRSQLKKATIPP